ncbi:TPA: 3'-5' exonuclease [Pseudomonas aeruginosa]|nr:3'-5' exonuclease [Pseudomonas aeruginosa]HEC1420450.1 3'-5' exonuclease [Pseudomonas aeruginosa]
MHQASHAIARRWMAQNAAILDTETTGLDEQAEIVEIAVVACSGETLFRTFVKPTKPIPAGVTEIHGITDAMVADAPTWPAVQAALLQILEGRQLVIWHADYDLRLIEQSAAAHGIEAPELYAECAQSVYKHFWHEPGDEPGSFRRQRLTKAAAQQGVEILGQEHRAEVDCLTTRGVIAAMASGQGAHWMPRAIA